jgi:hypothetical protein
MYPGFDMATTASMAAETMTFFRHVILEHSSGYRRRHPPECQHRHPPQCQHRQP